MIYTDNLAITFHSQALVCAGLNLNCAITVDCSLGKYKRSSWPNAADCSGSTPNLSDEVNRNIVQSEIEGGVFLGDLPPSTVLQIHTQHRSRNTFRDRFWLKTDAARGKIHSES